MFYCYQAISHITAASRGQVGAWTDDCIISTAFHAFSLQYDVILIEDGVSTASKQHFNAIQVRHGTPWYCTAPYVFMYFCACQCRC